MSPDSPRQERQQFTSAQWIFMFLLFLSVGINYMDRGNLGVAAPVLIPELGLRPAQMGFLLSAFFWTYAGFQVVGGWLVDRYDVTRVYALGFFVWSFATLATGAVSGFVGLCLMRLLLGIGESVAYPSYSKILMLTLAEHQRGLANAIIDAGTKVGPALGTLIGGLLIARFGWRVLFLGVGVASLVWIVPWLRWAPRIHVRQTAATAAPGFLEIMSRRSAWATFFGLFCYNYAWYFLLTWLPSYLVMERKFTMRMMAVYGALPFAATAVSAVFCGWLSDRQIARGGSVNKVRKTYVVAGVLATAAALPVATVDSDLASMISLVIGFAGMGLFTSNSWAVSQTIAGVEASGKWTGMQNGVGNLAGVTAPVITGWIVGRLGSFYVAFVVASAMLVAAAMFYAFLLGRIEPIRWKKAG